MKDVTVTSFGLVIAYLLPGMVALYGMSFRFPRITVAFETFTAAESNVGLFLITILGALILGLVANGLRSILFDYILGTDADKIGDLYAKLKDDKKLAAYRMIVDEVYRYHQWWGGLFFAAPLLYWGWLATPEAAQLIWIIPFIPLLAVELLAFFLASQLRSSAVKHIKKILEGA